MAFPLWGTIKDSILGAWSWLDDPIEGLWDGFRTEILGTWTWLDTIDDKIRDISWSHIAPKLGDWFWGFVVLNVTQMSKVGYRVLSTLWAMEWDDENKEAK